MKKCREGQSKLRSSHVPILTLHRNTINVAVTNTSRTFLTSVTSALYFSVLGYFSVDAKIDLIKFGLHVAYPVETLWYSHRKLIKYKCDRTIENNIFYRVWIHCQMLKCD